jgi:6-phosphogluconolactonase/glucosamine-6-phosphate isomerase/deaminase
MQFIRSDSPEEGRLKITDDLRQELQLGHKVLWLISGGSNIHTCRQILMDIPAEYSKSLTIMLNDERFGPVGHKDSNWRKFVEDSKEEGTFPQTKAKLVNVLRHGQETFTDGINYYERTAQDSFKASDIIISLLGMGEDGHIAGILPNSPAVSHSSGMVAGYKGSDGHLRMTLTFGALRQVNRAYLFAFGPEKKPALENLQSRELSIEDQPAQVLWDLPEAYVYNDQVEEKA